MSEKRFAFGTLITIAILTLVMFLLSRYTDIGQNSRITVNIAACVIVGVGMVIGLITSYRKYVK
jgi:hypothetical protein